MEHPPVQDQIDLAFRSAIEAAAAEWQNILPQHAGMDATLGVPEMSQKETVERYLQTLRVFANRRGSDQGTPFFAFAFGACGNVWKNAHQLLPDHTLRALKKAAAAEKLPIIAFSPSTGHKAAARSACPKSC